MEIKKSELRKIIKEQMSAFFVTPEALGVVSRSKTLDTALRGHGFKSKDNEVDEKELDRAIQITMRDLEAGAASRMRSKPINEARKLPRVPAGGYKGRAKANKKDFIKKVQSLVPKNKVKSLDMKQLNNLYDYGSSPEDAAKELMGEAKKKPVKGYDRIKRPPQVGDKVHIGHAQKGGAGVEGKVTKIAGRVIYITNDAGKTYKGPLKNTAIMEISGVDSLKPNDPHTPEDEAEKDAADDVMEAAEKEGKRITALRKILKGHTAGKIDGQIVDAFTAGGLVKLYDGLSEKNHQKFERLPLPKLVDFMWKQMRR